MTLSSLPLALPSPRSEPGASLALPRVGAHVSGAKPFQAAAERSAELIQINLSSPRVWAPPKVRADAHELATGALPVFVHAPYLINFPSSDELVRERSKTCLRQQVAAAAAVGARGVVVHGGHLTGGGDLELALSRWWDVFEDWRPEVPVLVENTASGAHAPARRLEALARLWEGFARLDPEIFAQIGFCLDTCHAHAGGEALPGLAAKVLSITGRIDLVHANDSRDGFDSGRDRHANFGTQLPLSDIAQLVLDANAPAVIETPGTAQEQEADVLALRAEISRLSRS